jgi:hypothetical protein
MRFKTLKFRYFFKLLSSTTAMKTNGGGATYAAKNTRTNKGVGQQAHPASRN